MVQLLSWAVALLPLAAAVPSKRAGPVVTLPGGATVLGSTSGTVDSFKGIPYAKPPVGDLRLKPPQAITNSGAITAVGTPKSCPQFFAQVDQSTLPAQTISLLLNSPFGQAITNSGEDCLTVNVQRPSTATSSSKLPVLFWIYGGGFEFGSTSTYDATELITTSMTQKKDIIYVSVNYRLGGFGFLAGKEILKDGSSNLGLRDQRLALQWVADNIAAFGGDPTKVTIWGESAGSISVFDQMALNGGDNTYKGKALFRGAIMDSGSIVPANPVDSTRAQAVYDTVVANGGCSKAADTLKCLRALDYNTFTNAVNSVPAIIGYTGIALSYLPRPDGTLLTKSPELIVAEGSYASVPFIIGDQEDEGTLFSLAQNNVTNEAQLVDYLNNVVFKGASRATVQGLVDQYPADPAAGSPFRTGALNNVYPEFKRLAAMQGDFVFTLTRRGFLNGAAQVKPTVPFWSYLGTYFYGTPILGTFHASDIIPTYGILPSIPSSSIQAYYLSFVNTLDPNQGTSGLLLKWPQWTVGKQLLNFGALANSLLSDDFRSGAYNYLFANTASLRI